MDGYALAGSSLPAEGIREFPIVGTALAGARQAIDCQAGECVRIMTGAAMPHGTDTVVMQEQAEVSEAGVRIDARHRTGQNVRLAGEDIAAGSKVFPSGRRLRAADLGVLASLGFGELAVLRRPRVAFFSTGDELRSIGQPLAEGEIYDSNRYTLHAMLTEVGVDLIDMGVVGDDPDALARAFDIAAEVADVVVTSGGVSVGEADYTKAILADRGQMSFWTIAMKPGRPLTFGHLGNAVFFGLPGNPVAVMLTFQQFVQPALRYLAGCGWPQPLVLPATSAVDLRKRPGRYEFVRGILERDAENRLLVRPAGAQGSGILTSMSRANCLILLEESCAGVTAGQTVQVQPFDNEL